MGPESRIWEIRPFGSMRGRRELVIGLAPFNPASPAYSTWLVSLLNGKQVKVGRTQSKPVKPI
jgi:hypothetical protein